MKELIKKIDKMIILKSLIKALISIVLILVFLSMSKYDKFINLINGTYIFKVIKNILMAISSYRVPLIILAKVLLLLLLILYVCRTRVISKIGDYFKSSNITKIDYIFMELIIVLIVCMFIFHKIYIVLLIIALVPVIMLIVRFSNIISKDKTNNNIKTISEVYKNDIKENDKIFISDEPCDVDLLNRSHLIESITSTINNCYPQKTFTIGLDGEWGVGKTTIMNIVLKKLDQDKFVIVSFDPCKYENSEVMLKSFYMGIAKSLHIVDFTEYRNYLNIFLDILFSEGKISSKVINYYLTNRKDKDINSIINENLKNGNKRLVILIDNLDRANNDILNFFLRSNYSIMDFSNTICIYLYNRELINNILKDYYNGESNFIDKIITLPISIPKTNNKKTELMATIVNNLKEKNIIYYKDMIRESDLLIFKNIREFILIMNLLISNKEMLEELELNAVDFMMINYIKNYNFELYERIYINRDILTYVNDDVYYHTKEKSEYLNKIKEKIIKNFIEIDQHYSYIMETMFSNVNDTKIDLCTFDKSDKEYRISNDDYFEMYFSFDYSKYSFNKKIIKDILNKYDNKKELEKNLKNFLFCTKVDYTRTIALEKMIDRNMIDDYDLLFTCLLDIYLGDNVCDTSKFLYKLIEKIDDITFNKLLRSIKSNYKNLYAYYVFSHNNSTIKRIQIINNELKTKIVKEVNNDKVYNLIKEKDYHIYYRMINKYINDRNIIDNYLFKCLNKKTIYRVIYFLLINTLEFEDEKKEYKRRMITDEEKEFLLKVSKQIKNPTANEKKILKLIDNSSIEYEKGLFDNI